MTSMEGLGLSYLVEETEIPSVAKRRKHRRWGTEAERDFWKPMHVRVERIPDQRVQEHAWH